MKARAFVVAAGWLMLGSCAAFTQDSIPALPLISANRYGAIGDGKTIDTAAIQAAIDGAARTGTMTWWSSKPVRMQTASA